MSAVAQPPAGWQLVSAPAPAWEVSLRWRPPGSARARVMGRVRFQAPDAARAREAAATALAARAGGEGRWSLGILRALTANAPGTHAYVVTFAAWESRGERFVRRDVHEHEVWATDATSARRLASEQVQAMPSYLPAWRVSRVAPRGTQRRPQGALGSDRRPQAGAAIAATRPRQKQAHDQDRASREMGPAMPLR